MRFIDNYFEKRAVSVYQMKSFHHEYGAFIALTFITKLGLSFFNGYAGYYLLKNYLISDLNSEKIAIIGAISILFFIELFLNLSLAFFFKASFRGNFKGAIGLVLLSGLFFAISFLLTTNGLAQRQGQKADNTAVIIDKFNFQTAELKKQAEQNRTQLMLAIETIKQNPAGWRGGKRDVLQPEQLSQINHYYSQIEQINNTLRNDLFTIETNKKDELSQNTGNVIMVEQKYYRTAISVMGLQLFINGLLMFFYSRIYGNTQKEQLAKDTVQKFATDIADTTDQLIKENISNQYVNYMNALRFQLGETDKKTIPITAKNDKKIGFVKETDDDRNNITVITEDKKTDTPVKNTLAVLPCKYCANAFQQRIYTQLFCCDEHRQKWHRENKGFDLNLYKKRKK
jgi:hypothetical protein